MAAADIETAVLDDLQKLLATPELVARTWATAKRGSEDEITEREVTILLADFTSVWSELFPAEQARIVQLLVERVDVQENALEVQIRAAGLASLRSSSRCFPLLRSRLRTCRRLHQASAANAKPARAP